MMIRLDGCEGIYQVVLAGLGGVEWVDGETKSPNETQFLEVGDDAPRSKGQ